MISSDPFTRCHRYSIYGSTISVQLTSWWHGSAYVQICNTIYHISFKYIT